MDESNAILVELDVCHTRFVRCKMSQECESHFLDDLSDE